MATEKRLIDANALKSEYEWLLSVVNPCSKEEIWDAIERIENAPTVDAVEVSSLGELGQLMMPYNGCPRGMIGERGNDGTGYHLTELDAITDVDGNRWIPVFEDDLSRLKAKEEAVEVVRCGKCLYYSETTGKDSGKPLGYGCCTKPFHITYIVTNEDFCSFGQRRADAKMDLDG